MRAPGSKPSRLIPTGDGPPRLHAPETRHLLRAVEQSADCIVITDLAGKIEYVNPRFEVTTGYSAAEVLGRTPGMLRSGRHPPEFYRNLWATLTRGGTWRGEFLNRRKDGTLYWEDASIGPVLDDSGAITHFVAIKQDITERKLAQERNVLFGALVENLPELCVIKDLALNVVAINAHGAALLGGKPAAAFVGRTIAEVSGMSVRSPAIRAFREAELAAQQLPPGQKIERETTMTFADGSRHTFLSRHFPVYDASGRILGTAYISSDITERKRQENALRAAKEAADHANQLKSTFLTNMSHELRTPLNAINGVAAMLVEQGLPPDLRSSIDLIRQSGETLLSLIEQILLFSKLQAGKAQLAPERFDLATVVARSLALVTAAAQAKELVLSCWIDRAVPAELIGDAGRLQQVFVNLLANAVKFTERGRVHLSIRREAHGFGVCRLSCRVVDTGIGIEPAALTKLFHPFSQTDASIERRFGGTGLGLAICKSLIGLMRGAITVRSRAGRGTAFRFDVALETPAEAKPVYARTQFIATGRSRFLVVAADPVLRAAVREILHGWGVTPVELRAWAGAPVPPCDAALVEIGSGDARPTDAPGRPTVYLVRRGPLPENLPAGFASVALPLTCLDLATALQSALAPRPPAAHPAVARLADRLPLRVLIVDDIATNRQTAQLLFRSLGYAPSLAGNGAEALAQLERATFDVVVMDVQMPVMDGLTATREIRRRYAGRSGPRVIALTANALSSDRDQCLAAGMDDYLSKPVLPRQLSACLERLFAQAEPTLVAPGPTRGATLVAAQPSEPPLVDDAHLAALLEGISAEQRPALLQDLARSFTHDFHRTLPQLVAACRDEQATAAAAAAHALKGGAATVGWTRLARRAADAVQLLRSGAFVEWAQLPAELQTLFNASAAEFARRIAPHPTPPCAPAFSTQSSHGTL